MKEGERPGNLPFPSRNADKRGGKQRPTSHFWWYTNLVHPDHVYSCCHLHYPQNSKDKKKSNYISNSGLLQLYQGDSVPRKAHCYCCLN